MAQSKTKPTKLSVTTFIASIKDESRQQDARQLVKLFKQVSGWKAQMWGPAIIGFGAYHYTYASGRDGSICVIGFSPRKANFAIYVADFPAKAALLKKLGKHKGGIKQCLYIDQVAQLDLKIFAAILAGGMAATKKKWPVTAN